MRIVRYQDTAGQVHYGAELPGQGVRRIAGDIFAAYTVTGEHAQVAKLLTPVPPANVWCIGTNYRKHAEECGAKIPTHPILFLKGPNALNHPGDPIVLPRFLRSDEVDYEAELAVVIGRACRNVTAERALDYVLGYTCINDVSARDWQGRFGGGQWSRGKTFDTFAPLGPALVTRDEIADPNALRLRTTIGGETLQDSSTADMIFNVPTLIAFLAGSTTLLPGTIIATGTPQGVGLGRTPRRWLQPGETVTIAIDGIGELTNPVIEEAL